MGAVLRGYSVRYNLSGKEIEGRFLSWILQPDNGKPTIAILLYSNAYCISPLLKRIHQEYIEKAEPVII